LLSDDAAKTDTVSATSVNASGARHDNAPDGLDSQDLQAIRAICLQAAAELGVSERGS